jgi:hypothetical protein
MKVAAVVISLGTSTRLSVHRSKKSLCVSISNPCCVAMETSRHACHRKSPTGFKWYSIHVFILKFIRLQKYLLRQTVLVFRFSGIFASRTARKAHITKLGKRESRGCPHYHCYDHNRPKRSSLIESLLRL